MELGVPVVLHPFLLEAVERFGRHYLHNLVGYPFETTLAAGSLILGGTLDRFPALEVVLVHGGGFLPYHIGRSIGGTRARLRVSRIAARSVVAERASRNGWAAHARPPQGDGGSKLAPPERDAA